MRRGLIFLLLWQMSEETHTKTLHVLDLALCYKIFSIVLKDEQLLPLPTQLSNHAALHLLQQSRTQSCHCNSLCMLASSSTSEDGWMRWTEKLGLEGWRSNIKRLERVVVQFLIWVLD